MTTDTTSKIDKQSGISLPTKVVGGVVVNKNVEANRAAAKKLSQKMKAQQAEKAQAVPVKSPTAVTSTRSSTNVTNKLLGNNVPKMAVPKVTTVAPKPVTKVSTAAKPVTTATKAVAGAVAAKPKPTVNVAANRAAASKLAAKMKK